MRTRKAVAADLAEEEVDFGVQDVEVWSGRSEL